MPTGTYVVYGIGGQFVVAVLLGVLIQPKKFKLFLKPSVVGWVALGGTLRGLAGVCFVLAEIRSNNVALVSVISNFKLIIVVVLGWWLLKERKHLWHKLSSAVVAMAGLAIMLWR